MKVRGTYRAKAGDILNLMDEITKVFFTENEWEESIFHFEIENLEHIGNSLHATEYLAFGKAPLARGKTRR